MEYKKVLKTKKKSSKYVTIQLEEYNDEQFLKKLKNKK